MAGYTASILPPFYLSYAKWPFFGREKGLMLAYLSQNRCFSAEKASYGFTVINPGTIGNTPRHALGEIWGAVPGLADRPACWRQWPFAP